MSKRRKQQMKQQPVQPRRSGLYGLFSRLDLPYKFNPPNNLYRAYAALLFVLFTVSSVTGALQPFMTDRPYKVDATARKVLPEQNPKFAEVLKYDAEQASFEYNADYTGGVNPESAMDSSSAPRVSASFPVDPSKGMSVNDPLSKVDLKLTPKFDLGQGKQDGNQVLYPLGRARGYLVYTAQASGVKEDILLARYHEDTMSYEYELGLADGLEARLESNGSVGVYGADLPVNGDVSTGTDADKALLEKVRTNADKTTLLFNIPTPVVAESGKTVSQVKAHFELEGNTLIVVAEKLRGASYPLSIDPSVYVETAQKLMRGNNETNIDFDVTNELIRKGKLSGGRFNSWTTGLALPGNLWKHATTVAGGYIYAVGGHNGSANVATVYWAKFNTTTGAMEAPNPGNGACASWCTNTVYNLPTATAAHSLVAYNGYLYVFGGENSGGRSSAVYIAKIGVNGEPSLWHPTDTNKNNWTYWYTATSLSTERSYVSAVAYNNRMYVVGGQTNASSGGVTTVEVADINPIGTLSTWSTTGMVALTSVRYAHNVLVYNDRLYVIGGSSTTVVQSSVQYIKLNSDGTMAGSWVSTTSMALARMSMGGNFATIWGGYIYVAGGCTELVVGGYCSVAGLSNGRDIQLASINADGSVTDWNDIIGITSPRIGYGLVAWRDTIYGIGGCTNQNISTGVCTTTTSVTQYGAINPDGDVSTVSNSQPSGTTPCTGGAPTNCDIPPAGDAAGQGGRMATGVIINNGYIYVIGGCTDISTTEECYNGGGQMSGNISYAALAVDGGLVQAATCPGTLYGSWCVDSTNRLNGTTGLGTMAATVFNNVIYVVGGTDGNAWSASVYRVTLNDNGSLAGAWTAQTFANLALGTARGYSFAFTRANPAASATYPGNLYVIGGCNNGTTSNGLGCGTYFTEVYKCNIMTTGALEEANATDCDTAGQQQLDSEVGGTAQGLGLMSGVVYANYIYLVGGSSPNSAERGEVMYAKIDNSNNIVATTGGIWQTSPNVMNPIRRRGFAFGYNGYLYSLAGYNGSASLNDLLYAKIDVSNGSISPFTTSFVTVNPRWDLKAIVANGYVYAFGGCSVGSAPAGCTAMTGSIQTFQLYNNYSGSPAAFNTANTIGVDRIGGSTTILNGYIYYAGGCTNIGCTTTTNTVYYAVLNADGTVGTWTAAANNLPAVRAWGKLVAAGGTLYYAGGQIDAGTAQTTVYYSTPASGVPAAWGTATNGLLAARTEIGATVWNDRIYVTGGHTGGTRQTTVYRSPSLTSGGNIGSAWTSTTAFSVARSGHVTIAYANNLYVLGGYTGADYLNDVQFAKINSDGTIGTWSYSTHLPQRVYQADGFAANGYMYIFGGRSAAAVCTNNTYITPISANTTIASGNNPTGIGEWSQTNVEYSGARYGVAAAYDQGRAYVLGGGCAAYVAAGERAYLTALQSQPQVAKYSRMMDTDTDVFPTKWLMNGLDNDIGARWRMRYRSSTNTAAAWGQETNYGTVVLGTPANYIPYDAVGANTNFARYYYMTVSIDSSQAFGYPEDVTRGPTIADMALFFTSDPGRRLRHGATFTGGELQPLDTPFP